MTFERYISFPFRVGGFWGGWGGILMVHHCMPDSSLTFERHISFPFRIVMMMMMMMMTMMMMITASPGKRWRRTVGLLYYMIEFVSRERQRDCIHIYIYRYFNRYRERERCVYFLKNIHLRWRMRCLKAGTELFLATILCKILTLGEAMS